MVGRYSEETVGSKGCGPRPPSVLLMSVQMFPLLLSDPPPYDPPPLDEPPPSEDGPPAPDDEPSLLLA